MNIPKFNNNKLLEQAFTHRSYLNEVKGLPADRQGKLESNERLEFLGDSILSFVVSKYLYDKYPQFKEGVLTNLRSLLVNTKSLAGEAKRLEFGKKLLLSKGEEEAKGRENPSLLADSFEAFIGALFLDSGIKPVEDFIENTLLKKTEEIVNGSSLKDPKSLLQEYVQAKIHTSPIYKVIEEKGPSHAKTFTVAAFVNNEKFGEGQGKSKQEAQANAAKQALEKLVEK